MYYKQLALQAICVPMTIRGAEWSGRD
jgi:hypothetical protein